MSVYYNTSSGSKSRTRQIKIVLHSIARPTGKKSIVDRKAMHRKNMASPMLSFFSGPGFEPRELELDLRDLVGVNIKDLDDSLKDILLDDPKRPSSADTDDIDNVSIVSEISTCSSAVTVTLEPVDEEPSTTSPKPPSSPAQGKIAEPWSCPSSSEAEEEDSRKSGRKTKKISNLFSFNSGPANPNSGHSEIQLERSSSDRKKRRSSLTKLMSPLALSIFTASGLPTAPINVAEMRPELFEKERKFSGQTKTSRKLSLTMFQKQSSSDKSEPKKRRNTDPNLIQKLKNSTTVESESQGLKAVESDETSQEKVRKVAFNALAPRVQDLTKADLRVEPGEASFKDEDIKLREMMGNVLRSHLLSMGDYKRETCDRTGRSISKIIKTLVESIKESEGVPSKVACLVYIAAVRDEGIFMSTQALWDSNQDNFAAASFRNDSVFGLSVVIATPYI